MQANKINFIFYIKNILLEFQVMYFIYMYFLVEKGEKFIDIYKQDQIINSILPGQSISKLRLVHKLLIVSYLARDELFITTGTTSLAID